MLCNIINAQEPVKLTAIATREYTNGNSAEGQLGTIPDHNSHGSNFAWLSSTTVATTKATSKPPYLIRHVMATPGRGPTVWRAANQKLAAFRLSRGEGGVICGLCLTCERTRFFFFFLSSHVASNPGTECLETSA